MKSVTKTYTNIADGASSGLTAAQCAGVYTVYIKGTVSYTGNYTTGTKTIDAYLGLEWRSESVQSNRRAVINFMVDSAYRYCGFNQYSNTFSTGGSNDTFSGTVTYYYFE